MTDLPLPPDQSPTDSATASGLDAAQIAPQDLAELQAQFHFSALTPGVDAQLQPLANWELQAGLRREQLQSAALPIAEVRSARMKLVALPERVRVHQQRLPEMHARLHRDLKPALAQPIRRNRVAPHELSAAEQAAVVKALKDKHGTAARLLKLEGVYREVPLEASKSVHLDESLRFCVFTLPVGVAVNRLRSGYALVVASGESGKTYPLLVRL
jgi:hypothetical protein